MENKLLQELLVQQKTKYIQLTEVLNVTIQMADAVERDDNVSMSLLIAMRQEPLLVIDEIQQVVGKRLEFAPRWHSGASACADDRAWTGKSRSGGADAGSSVSDEFSAA